MVISAAAHKSLKKAIVELDPNQHVTCLNTAWDSYKEPDGVESVDEFGRECVYENLRIVNMPAVPKILACLLRVPEEVLPKELIKYATDELQLNSPGSYVLNRYMGYYGEEYDITCPKIGLIRKWYFENKYKYNI